MPREQDRLKRPRTDPWGPLTFRGQGKEDEPAKEAEEEKPGK